MAKSKGTYRALLGVLIVFIIPLLVVSVVYLSKKPPVYTLPVIDESPVKQTSFLTLTDDTLQLNDYKEDVKFFFHSDSGSIQRKTSALKAFYTETQSYPKKTFKDPYPAVLFVNVFDGSGLNVAVPEKRDHWFTVSNTQVNDAVLNQYLSAEHILLLDRDGRIRSRYQFNKASIEQMKNDLQNLMAETFHVNSKEERKKQDKF